MASLEELTTPLTPEQVKDTHYSVFTKIGTNVTSWKPGNPIRTFIAAVSTWQSSFTYWASNAVKSRFLTLSRGDWLTANAKYDYGTDRNTATFATGAVSITNTSANVYDFDPEDLTLKYSTLLSDGLTPVTYYYTNTAAVHVSSGTGTPNVQDVVFRCTIEGTAPSIPAGATVTLQPEYSGMSATVVTPVLGSDTETDQSLINRSQQAASAISPNGPADAYRYVATSTLVNGAQVCTRVHVVAGYVVTVYLGNASGPLTGAELAAVNLEVQTKVVPLGIVANVVPGTTKNLSFDCTVWCNKTVMSRDSIVNAIRLAIATYCADFPMGGNPVANVDVDHAAGSRWMYYDAARAVVERSLAASNVGNPIYHVEMLLNGVTSDVAFTPGEIAVLASTPSVTVYFA
jgi:hypothetical protein